MTEPLWRITGIADTTVFDKGNNAYPGRRVDVTLMDGTSFSIEVKNSDFDPNNVGDLVHEEAVKIAAVLSSEGPPVNSMQHAASLYGGGLPTLEESFTGS